MLACVRLPAEGASDDLCIPEYLENTNQVREELEKLCKEGLESYHNVANFIADQASNLPIDGGWPEELKQTQKLLKAGVKDTLADIDNILGVDKDSDHNSSDILFDVDGTTVEDVDLWRNLPTPASMDDENTLVEDDYPAKETFDSMAAKLERHTRKILKKIRSEA